MSVLNYEPWLMLNELSTGLDRMLTTRQKAQDNPAGHWQPAVDILESDKDYLICLDLPGVDPKRIEVSMEKGVLQISGEREASQSSDEKPLYHRRERFQGGFKRSFQLPDDATTDEITASSENGVLRIVISKQAEQQPRRIEISH